MLIIIPNKLLLVCVSGGELWQGDGDVVVILQLDGLHGVKRHVGEDHKILAHAIDAVHCVSDERNGKRTKTIRTGAA